MYYSQAFDLVRNRDSKKLKCNTYAIRNYDDSVSIRLHATDIITFHSDNSFNLSSGGWYTPTTSSNINRYVPFGSVYSEKGTWFFGGYLFRNGMTVFPDHTCDTPTYNHYLLSQVFDTEITSDDQIKEIIDKMSTEDLIKLWKGRRSEAFRDAIVSFLPLDVIPVITPVAKGNESRYQTAIEKLRY